MKKRKIQVFTIGITLILILLYIFYYQEDAEKTADDDRQYTIGLSFDSLVVERWQRDLESFVAYANEMNIEVNVQIANDDIALQKKQVADLIEAKVDLLVILPKNYDAFVDELKLAEKESIKVIAYDRLLTGGKIDLYISFDNNAVGENLASEVIKGIKETPDGNKNIVIINGDPNDYNSVLINEGIKNSIDSFNDDSINILAEVWADGWRESKAFSIIDTLLNLGVRIDGVVAANDTLATGAIQALSERSLSGKVIVVGQDAELSACQRIVEGTQLATIYKPINALSKAAVDYGVSLIKDQSIDYYDTLQNEYANFVVPYVKLNTLVVNKENIDSIIIDSGFHEKESVYLNMN